MPQPPARDVFFFIPHLKLISLLPLHDTSFSLPLPAPPTTINIKTPFCDTGGRSDSNFLTAFPTFAHLFLLVVQTPLPHFSLDEAIRLGRFLC